MSRKLQLCALALLALFACKTPQPLRPEARYDMTQPPVPMSSLYIPVRITRTDLQRIVNQSVAGLKMDNSQMSGQDYRWSLAVTRPLAVDLAGQQITSTIPMDVQVSKNLGITSLSANGELEVTFKTQFNIREDWSVQTYTTLERHRWLRQPVARVAGVAIPIAPLTNWLIDYSRKRLTETIDKQIREQIDLRALLSPLWTVLKRPVQLSEAMDLWFRFEPRVAGIEPFRIEGDGLHSAVHMTGISRVKAGGEPALIDVAHQPQFSASRSKNADSLRIVIQTDISYAQAERIAEQKLIGQTFGSGKNQVTVEGIDLFGQGDHLIASVRLKGGYKGQVHLRGKPVLDAGRRNVEMENFDFDVNTRNVLHSSAAWLFKGNIRAALREALVFPLDDNLSEVTKEIDAQINSLKPGPWIRLETPGMALGLNDIRLTEQGMVLDFLLAGKVTMHLKALD